MIFFDLLVSFLLRFLCENKFLLYFIEYFYFKDKHFMLKFLTLTKFKARKKYLEG